MDIKQLQKEKAIELLEQLGIFKPYVEDFKKRDYVCVYENFAGFWTFQRKELNDKLKEIEKKYDCIVYAVTHEYTEFGECYDFLVVTSEESEWSTLIGKYENNFYAFAYVWNKDYEYCSEFGDVIVKSAFGGLKRIK